MSNLFLTAKKAMKTLDISKGKIIDEQLQDPNTNENFVPTLSNVFRSILREANREHEVRRLHNIIFFQHSYRRSW